MNAPRSLEYASARKALKPISKQERIRRHHAATEANIRTQKTGKRGARDRSILVEFTVRNVEHRYHATKGWRRYVKIGGRA